MATTRPFAYNTGSTIPGTEQVGDLSVGTPTSGFTSSPQYWNGPDEDLGYVIAAPVSGDTQPTPLSLTWDPNYAGTGIVLSSGNTVATSGQIQSSVLGTRLITSPNKVMYSIRVNQLVTGQIGFGLQDMDLNSYVGGFDAKSIGFSSDGDYLHAETVQDSGLPTWGSVNDVVDIALDLNTGIWWIRVNGGNWNGTRNEDPSSGTGSVNSAGLNNLYPAITPFPVNIQGQVTLLSQPIYSVPAGFTFLGDITASVGFYGTSGFSDSEFINLSQSVSSAYGIPQTFSSATDASTWLTTNGFWNSYVSVTPTPTGTLPVTSTPTTTSTPTPSVTNTQTPTNTPTPTLTQTPTSTDSSSITTYSISGCTNLNVLVVDLGPGFIVPGDVNYYTFTGATPSGCYSVIGKINAPIDDAVTASFGYGGCNDCIDVTTTTYTISGCTTLNVLVADLGPGAFVAGDIYNMTFTGATPSGCYRIVNKIVATPTDTGAPLTFYLNCDDCEASLVTPTPTATPTNTSTPTPSVTNTQTSSVTPTLTPTPTRTSSTPTPTPTLTQTPSPTPYTTLAGSLLFNGSNQSLGISPGVTFGAGTFTLEGWFYNNGLFNNVGIVGSPVTSPTGCLNLYFANGTTITSDRNGGGGSFSYTMGSTITANQWHYLIYNRNADGTTAVYIDGVRCTATSTDTLNYNTATDTIGRYYGGYWPGYWTNMRMTIGTAVYNSNLTTQSTPRGPLTSLANTKYLMLGAVVTTDSSGTQTVTNNNGVTQTSDEPF